MLLEGRRIRTEAEKPEEIATNIHRLSVRAARDSPSSTYGGTRKRSEYPLARRLTSNNSGTSLKDASAMVEVWPLRRTRRGTDGATCTVPDSVRPVVYNTAFLSTLTQVNSATYPTFTP